MKRFARGRLNSSVAPNIPATTANSAAEHPNRGRLPHQTIAKRVMTMQASMISWLLRSVAAKTRGSVVHLAAMGDEDHSADPE